MTLRPLCRHDRRFLLGALAIGAPNRGMLESDARSVRDWEAVLLHATRAAVGPAVAHAVVSHSEVSACVPSGVRVGFAEVLASRVAANALLIDDLGRLAAAFERRGVRLLVLKGAALICDGYPGPGARHTDDIDVLVHPGDGDSALRCLEDDLGFRVEARFTDSGVDGRPLEEHLHREYHAAALRLSPRGTAVDLHFSIPGERADAALHFEALWGRRRVGAARGVAVMLPSRADLIAQLCDHVVVHHGGRPRNLPRHVADLSALVADPSVDEADLRAARGRGDPFALALSLALVSAAHGLVREPARSLVLAALFPHPSFERWYDLALEVHEAGDRIRRDLTNPALIARKLFPVREFVARSYGVEVDDPALPWLYVHRLATFRWLRRREGR